MAAAYDTYFYHRAEMEMLRARNAACPEAARAHQEMANLYLEQFYRPEPAPARVTSDAA